MRLSLFRRIRMTQPWETLIRFNEALYFIQTLGTLVEIACSRTNKSNHLQHKFSLLVFTFFLQRFLCWYSKALLAVEKAETSLFRIYNIKSASKMNEENESDIEIF